MGAVVHEPKIDIIRACSTRLLPVIARKSLTKPTHIGGLASSLVDSSGFT